MDASPLSPAPKSRPAASDIVPSPCSARPQPGPEHAWLERFVGRWESEIEVTTGPGQTPLRARGVEEARMLGGVWLISEGRNLSFPYSFHLSLGFDPWERVYVGTWIDSMSPYLWRYRGDVDLSASKLTLETQGPAPGEDGRHVRIREETQFVSADHRIFTSHRLDERGVWQRCLRIEFRRAA